MHLIFSENKCKEMLKSKLKNNESMINEVYLPIKCPYSHNMMKCPVRGIDCDHIKCFDFENYLKCCSITNKFTCPLCKKITYISDLFQDLYVKRMIQEFCEEFGYDNIDDHNLFVNSEGNWKAKKIKIQNELVQYSNFDSNAIDKIEKMNY